LSGQIARRLVLRFLTFKRLRQTIIYQDRLGTDLRNTENTPPPPHSAMYPGDATGGGNGGCSSSPQPCPSEPGRTFCQTNQSKDQCHHSPAPCPPCPASPPPGGHGAPHSHPAHGHNHMVAIDRLSPDLLSSSVRTQQNSQNNSIEYHTAHAPV
jgi:hypothetical protein